MSDSRLCEECGSPVRADRVASRPVRSDAAYCSNACRQRAYRRRLASELADFGDDPDADRRLHEAELINSYRLATRDLLDPAKVSALTPIAQAYLIDTFEAVVASIRNAPSRVTDTTAGDRS